MGARGPYEGSEFPLETFILQCEIYSKSPRVRGSCFQELKIGHRLMHASLLKVEKHPLIIPGCSYAVTLLINHCGEIAKHQGRIFNQAQKVFDW